MSIIIFLVIIALLILVHEFGHFIVAKKSGVRVDEFGLGFPPRIWGFKKGETIYSINWIPFGGFVRIHGENPDEDSTSGPDAGRSLVNKPKKIQAAVFAAGVIFNIIFAWILLSIGLTFGMPTSEASVPKGYALQNTQLIITDVLKDSPADRAGIKAGDIVLGVRAWDAELVNPATAELQNFIAEHGGVKVNFTLKRIESDKDVLASAVPKDGIVPGKAAIGISMDKVGVLKLPLHQALWQGTIFTGSSLYVTAKGLWSLIASAFSGSTAVLKQVAGPVGLASMVGNISQLGFSYVLSFIALISVNLAVLNLVPFPALDGGRLLFLLIEAIKGSPINPKIANTLNTVGFLLLLLLMVAVTYQDIGRIVTG